MKSEPGALSGFSCLITCLSSLSVIACKFSGCGVCVATSLSTSGSRVLS